MTNAKVDQIEKNLQKAQELIEEAARLLCQEPGDTIGGRIYTFLCKKAEEVVEPIHHTYKLRP